MLYRLVKRQEDIEQTGKLPPEVASTSQAKLDFNCTHRQEYAKDFLMLAPAAIYRFGTTCEYGSILLILKCLWQFRNNAESIEFWHVTCEVQSGVDLRERGCLCPRRVNEEVPFI